MNMTGIIFSELYGGGLDALTSDRNMGAIPFGGRYRLVDFVLSNMVNSGITNVGVLARQHYHSLMDHLANSQEWDLNRKNGGLLIIPPFATESYDHNLNGKLDELRNALDYLQDSDSPYVLLADAHVVCNIDYRSVLESHIASGCDLTVVATREPASDHTVYSSVIQVGDNGCVSAFLLDCHAKQNDYAGMDVYIMEREKLIHLIRECSAKGKYHFERDFIQTYFNSGALSVNLYEFRDVHFRIRSVEDYLHCCLKLIDPQVGASLFRPDRPIYTRVTDEVPTFYGLDCHLSGCIVADGCIIDGNAEESVFSRGVRIGENASVKRSVIMQGSVVGEGAELEYVIMDKWATVSAGCKLKGHPSAPVIIRKGVAV